MLPPPSLAPLVPVLGASYGVMALGDGAEAGSAKVAHPLSAKQISSVTATALLF